MDTQKLRTTLPALRQAFLPGRLLLAVKTAVAVAVAWMIAPLMPGVTDEYPYYAPFGALISMYPTLMSSVRSSLQTLLGLAVGVGLAAVIMLTVGPSVWTVAAAVAAGVLISGTGWFGIGREYIPMAALFVLIVGGAHADEYSISYVTQSAVGVVVGLIVNVIVPPAPLVAEASARIDAFAQRLAAHLHDIGDAVTDSWPPEHTDWAEDAGALAETSRTLRAALAEADDSRRGNPRAWLRRVDTSDEHARLEVLDEIAHQIRDISGCLSDTIWERPAALPLDPQLVVPLAEACHAVAELISGTDAHERGDLRGRAADAVDRLLHAVHTRSVDARSVTGPGVLSAMHLQRILLLTEPDEPVQPDTGATPAA